MASFIRNPKEFWSGVMFVIFGLAVVTISRNYAIGSAGRMGPGYFPTALGSILGLLGLIAVVRSFFTSGEGLEKFAIKEAFLILMAVLLFGVLVRGAGLIVAILTLVMMSAYASSKFEWKSSLLLAIGAATFCVAVFVLALGVPMPVVGPWFGF